MGKDNNPINRVAPPVENFKVTRAKIKEMYRDDVSVRRNVNKAPGLSASIGTLTPDTLKTYYYNLSADLNNQRKYPNRRQRLYIL